MSVARLREIALDLRGGFASGEDDPDGVIQFRMNNVGRSGEINWDKVRRVPKVKAKKDLLVEEGDILFNATNSPELVGKTALFAGFSEPVTFSNHFLRIRSNRTMAEPAYLARWLQREFERGRFEAMCRSWVNQASITKDQLASLEIPLPPLDEQWRIAATLDRADVLRRQRKRSLELLAKLSQSIFLEMFGDLVGTENFPRGTISDWVADFDTGKNLAPDPDDQQANGYRVLKVSAVTTGVFLPNEAKPLPPAYQPPESHLVREGDLLFSRANTAELVGATAYVEAPQIRLVLPDKIWRFVWQKDNAPHPRFVHTLFSTPSFRRELSKRATGTSGSMKNISKAKVLEIGVGLPDRRQQDQFAVKLTELQSVVSSAATQATMFDAQFCSLQHRAFSGQL